jgi:hypothetical protein
MVEVNKMLRQSRGRVKSNLGRVQMPDGATIETTRTIFALCTYSLFFIIQSQSQYSLFNLGMFTYTYERRKSSLLLDHNFRS